MMLVMRRERKPNPRLCSIDVAIRVLGARWSLVILRELTFGVHKFDEIAANTGAARDILANRLRSLEDTGLVARRRYEAHPPRFEYHLTPAGTELFGLMHVMREWGDDYIRDDPEYIGRYTHSCGHPLRTAVVCRACNEEIRPDSVEVDRYIFKSDVSPAEAKG